MCPEEGTCTVVLVVDDDEDVRGSIADTLALDGHVVVEVENGEQALGALAVATPELLVTDLSMPFCDGLSLIARVRAADRTRQIPICVVSSDLAPVPAGVISVRKPFDVAELLEGVRLALAQAPGTKGA